MMVIKNRILVILFYLLCFSLFHINQAISGTQEDIINWLTANQNDDGSWDGSYKLVEDYGLDDATKNNEDTGSGDLWIVWPYQKLACKFIPAKTYACTKVVLPLMKVIQFGWTNEPEGNVLVKICRENNNTPGESLGLSTVIANSLGDTSANITFNFSSPVLLTSGESYYIVLERDVNNTGTKLVAWEYRALGSGETSNFMYNSSSSWNNYSGRLLFEVWGSEQFVTYSPHNSFYANANATLSAAKALLSYNGTGGVVGTLSQALKWIENQEFSNVEYISRQIEVLALAGKKCDVYTDKLLALKNTDGGWGESTNYKSNPLDTTLALKALLRAGYRDKDIIKPALELIISYTNKINPLNSSDPFRWSTFYPTYHYGFDNEYNPIMNWYCRNTSLIVSSNILELIHDYYAFFDDAFFVSMETKLTNRNFEGFDPIKSQLELFILTELGKIKCTDFFHESALITRVLYKCNYGAYSTLSASITNITALLHSSTETINEVEVSCKDLNDDPYLTAIALETLAGSVDSLGDVTISLDYEQGNFVVSLSANVLISQVSFYIKKGGLKNYELLPFNWAPQTTNEISIPCPSNILGGDIMAVSINHSSLTEKTYYLMGMERVTNVLPEFISVFRLNEQGEIIEEIEDSIIYKTNEPSSVRIQTKIATHYYYPKVITINYYLQDNQDHQTPMGTSIVTILPSQQVIIDSLDIDFPTNIVGTIHLKVSVSDIPSVDRYFYVISGDNATSAQNLKAPLFPAYEIVAKNRVLISWEAPLDPNVVAYKVFRGTVSKGITNALYLECDIYMNETYKIYSLDKNNNISTTYAEIPAEYSSENDIFLPKINIIYPQPNEIILSNIAINHTNATANDTIDNVNAARPVTTFEILGSIQDYTEYEIYFDTHKYYPSCYTTDSETVIKTIQFDNDTITLELKSGNHTLEIKAKNATSGWVSSGIINFQVQRWTKQNLIEVNNPKHPSWNFNGEKLVFSFDRKVIDGMLFQDYAQNIWQINNFTAFDSDPTNTSLSISQLTTGFFNNIEPISFSDDTFVYTSYRTEARNLIIKKPDTEYIIESPNALKSFYNPDYVEKDGISYCVSSDELGELTLTAIGSAPPSVGSLTPARRVNVTSLTRNLTEDDNKYFLCADKPNFKLVEGNKLLTVFEGYTFETPLNALNDRPYINSDIYYLEISPLPEEKPLGFSSDPTSIDVHLTSNWLFACGPYEASNDGTTDAMQFYFGSVDSGTCTIQCALYSGNDNAPTTKLEETDNQIFSTSFSSGIYTLQFKNTVNIVKNTKYWFVINYSSEDYDNNYPHTLHTNYHATSPPTGKIICHLSYNFSQGFPSPFPNSESFNYEMEMSLKYFTNPTTSLTRITDTPHEGETSPVWFNPVDNGIDNDGFLDANIAFVKTKDFTGDTLEEDMVYVGNITTPVDTSPYLSNMYPITLPGFVEGAIQHLDYQNYYLAFEELLYNGDTENTSFTSHIAYLKMDTDVRDAYTIETSIANTTYVTLQSIVTITAGSDLYIKIQRAGTSTLLQSARYDYDIYDDSNTVYNYTFDSSNQVFNPSVTFSTPGKRIAETLLIFKEGKQISKKFIIKVNENQ